MVLYRRSLFIVLAFVAVGLGSNCLGQGLPQIPVPAAEQPRVDSPDQSKADPHPSGSIQGTVVDQSGAVVAGAQVTLTEENQVSPGNTGRQETRCGGDGQFSFANVAPGAFHLVITSPGFAPQTSSGILHEGEIQNIPQIQLGVATTSTEVQVGLSRSDVAEEAEEEIKVEEKQRVFGVLPNFYVSYVADPVRLTSKQKFEIAWKTLIDPATLIFVGGAAGIEQAQNHFNEYGQGAQGYGKRFGAGYADTVAGTLIGSALLPALLKQDPRYFYKGRGSKGSRFLYAIANSVICKGDNRHWQPSYSNILGSLAAGGISNLYYPAQDRNGAGLTFENAAVGIGATAAANLFQEFVVRKLTPNISHHDPGKP
jgi:hypothetical protein